MNTKQQMHYAIDFEHQALSDLSAGVDTSHTRAVTAIWVASLVLISSFILKAVGSVGEAVGTAGPGLVTPCCQLPWAGDSQYFLPFCLRC